MAACLSYEPFSCLQVKLIWPTVTNHCLSFSLQRTDLTPECECCNVISHVMVCSCYNWTQGLKPSL